ncbi:MAG: response regulator [Nitrospirota bacterium]|nr:MAG: response regulator [Nitrospirota bacterium]
MSEMKYCICCGEDVPCHTVIRNEREEVICSNCGFPLEVKESWSDDSKNDIAYVAEDSDTVRNIIVKMLKDKGLVDKVVACKNGAELLKAVTDELKEKLVDNREPHSGFAIIDLNMPIMDGLTAARSIRSLEENYKIERMPIIFFSSIVANEKIRSLLNSLDPAVYINKGKTPNQDLLILRVETLLKYIGDKYLNKAA